MITIYPAAITILGRSVAKQLVKFNPTLKADVMYQIQLVLSMKMKENVDKWLFL